MGTNSGKGRATDDKFKWSELEMQESGDNRTGTEFKQKQEKKREKREGKEEIVEKSENNF